MAEMDQEEVHPGGERAGERNTGTQTQTNQPHVARRTIPSDASDTSPQQSPSNKSEEQVLLRQLLVAIEGLSTRLVSMDNTNTKLLRAFLGYAKSQSTPSPPSGSHWPFEEEAHKSYDMPKAEAYKGKGIQIDTDGDKAMKDVLGKMKDVSTICISDDDEDKYNKQSEEGPKGMYVRGTTNCPDPTIKKGKLQHSQGAQSETEKVGIRKPFSSNYRRGAHCPSPSSTSVRKLSFTPSELERERGKKKTKVGSTEDMKLPSPLVKGSMSKKKSPPAKASKKRESAKNSGQAVFKNLECNFIPPSELNMSPTATHVAVYVFHPTIDPGEVIFKVGTNLGTRADFQTLCPGKKVSREIILMMALKITLNQLNSEIKSTWCLPPSFADDVAVGCTTEELIKFYGHDWLGRYDDLKLVYIRVVDNYGHWFLIVISINEEKIYLMDSCLPDVIVDSRRYNIRKQAGALARMLLYMYDGYLCDNKDLAFEKYEISQARGIPSSVNSDTSGLWVVEWMHMQNNFTSNVFGVMDENVVRMEVAMRLLLDDHNECKREIIDNSAEHWLLVTSKPTH